MVAIRKTALFSALGILLWAGPAAAEEVRLGGMRFRVPESWSREGGAWVERRAGNVEASLVAAARPGPTSVESALVEGGKRGIAAQMSGAGAQGFRVEDLRVTELDGVPAYRIRTSRGGATSRIEQLQFLVSGKATLALTFTCGSSNFASEEAVFEGIARSVRVEERAGILDEVPASFCGALLGVLAGVGIAARRARKNHLTFLAPSRRVRACSSTRFATT